MSDEALAPIEAELVDVVRRYPTEICGWLRLEPTFVEDYRTGRVSQATVARVIDAQLALLRDDLLEAVAAAGVCAV